MIITKFGTDKGVLGLLTHSKFHHYRSTFVGLSPPKSSKLGILHNLARGRESPLCTLTPNFTTVGLESGLTAPKKSSKLAIFHINLPQNATWKPICSNSFSLPVLPQVPLYLRYTNALLLFLLLLLFIKSRGSIEKHEYTGCAKKKQSPSKNSISPEL